MKTLSLGSCMSSYMSWQENSAVNGKPLSVHTAEALKLLSSRAFEWMTAHERIDQVMSAPDQ